MKYLITDTALIRLGETACTIQNLSQSEIIEVSDNANFNGYILLFPQTQVHFNGQLYIRSHGELAQPAEISVVTFIVISGGGGSSSTPATDTSTTDTDVDNYLDGIFNGSDDGSNNTDVDNYLDDIFGATG